MAKGDITIELNGRRYDARTGEPVSESTKTDANPPQQATQWPPQTSNESSEQGQIPAERPIAHKASHVHKRTNRSLTLRRKAVHKPSNAHRITPDIKHKSSKTHDAKPSEFNLRRTKINQKKLHHAQSTPTHESVKKFSDQTVARSQQSLTVPHYEKPVSAPDAALSPHPFLQQLLQNGLERAEGHLQPPHRPKRRRNSIARLAPVGAACLAFALLLGFYTYQNVPNFALRIASQQSGVTATMPKYVPAGYNFDGPIVWTDNRLTISFKLDESNQSYSLSQQRSEWTSDNLLSDHVAMSTDTYETHVRSGKTIYLYGTTATWVEGGVWYTINDNAGLDTEQLLKIAGSI